LNDDYNKCVDLYLESSSLAYEDKIKAFNYINNKFKELKIILTIMAIIWKY